MYMYANVHVLELVIQAESIVVHVASKLVADS